MQPVQPDNAAEAWSAMAMAGLDLWGQALGAAVKTADIVAKGVEPPSTATTSWYRPPVDHHVTDTLFGLGGLPFLGPSFGAFGQPQPQPMSPLGSLFGSPWGQPSYLGGLANYMMPAWAMPEAMPFSQSWNMMGAFMAGSMAGASMQRNVVQPLEAVGSSLAQAMLLPGMSQGVSQGTPNDGRSGHTPAYQSDSGHTVAQIIWLPEAAAAVAQSSANASIVSLMNEMWMWQLTLLTHPGTETRH